MQFSVLSVPSIVLLSVYTLLNTWLTVNPGYYELKKNAELQILLFVIFSLAWFALMGFNPYSAIFCTIALEPAAQLYSYGMIFLEAASLTPSELMSVVTTGLLLATKRKKKNTLYFAVYCLLIIICGASALMKLDAAYFGGVARLLLIFILVGNSLTEKSGLLATAFLHGMLMWPFVIFAHATGFGGTLNFFTFNYGAAFRPEVSGSVLVGGPNLVVFGLFIVPFLLGKNKKTAAILAGSFFIPYIVFSWSRSLLVSIFLFLVIFLLMTLDYKKLIFLLIATILTGACIINFSFISFDTSKNVAKLDSNLIRESKMNAAWKTFKENMLIGVGYNTVYAFDTRQQLSTANLFTDHITPFADVKSSAEFTPLQVLAEIGIVGGSIFLLFLGSSIFYFFKILKKRLSDSDKSLAIFWFIWYFTFFLAGNFLQKTLLYGVVPALIYAKNFRR